MSSVFRFPSYSREMDVRFLYADPQDGLVRVSQRIFGDSGSEAVTGVQKLTQQVVLRLLTRYGGQMFEAGEGSQLITSVLRQVVNTAEAASTVFVSTVKDIQAQFDADLEEYPDTPADEILQSLSLLSVTVTKDTLRLHLQITSQLGAQQQFTLPIEI